MTDKKRGAFGFVVLSLLMMQNGTVMEDEYRTVLFHEMPEGMREQRVLPPGQEALRFYTDFASPVKEVYTWNEEMDPSLDAFAAGKAGFFFGYSYHRPIIDLRAPKLNYSVARVPQIAGNKEVNFANYFVEVVSKKSNNQEWAWDLIKFLTEKEINRQFLEKTSKPTALRVLIMEQLEDVDMEAAASQVLTAKSWYKGYDALAAEEILLNLISQAGSGQVKLKDALESAAAQVQQTTYSRSSEL